MADFEVHFEEFLHLAGLGHDEALIAWGGFYFRRGDSPYGEWLAGWDEKRGDVADRVTTRIECAEYFETRDAALMAHATQIDPNSRWFAVPLEVQRDVWPYEEYELVRSLVDTTLPEDDLFSGISEKVSA